MALSLSAELAAAQEYTERQPIVRLISTTLTSVLPFEGYAFNSSTDAETNPDLTTTATGRLASVNTVSNTTIVYRYSDTDLINFATANVVTGTNIRSNTLVEYPGYGIEVIYIDDVGSTRNIRHVLIDETGTVLSGPTTITSVSEGTAIIDNINATRLANGTFLIVYQYYLVATTTYYIYQITTSDFSSFSAGADITPSGLTQTSEIGNPVVLQESGGDVSLFFDYVDIISANGEIHNIFYSISTDNGASYGSATNVTSITTLGHSALSPSITLNSSNQITIAYYDLIGSVYVNASSPDICASDCASYSAPGYLHYDPVDDYLYATMMNVTVGVKELCFLMVIDCSDFSVQDCYSSVTTPSTHPMYHSTTAVIPRNACKADSHFFGFCNNNNSQKSACCIDHSTQTVYDYFFIDNATFSVTANVDIDWRVGETIYDFETYSRCMGTAVDSTNGFLYVCLQFQSGATGRNWIGYFDLAEGPSGGFYTFHETVYDSELEFGEIGMFYGMHLDVAADILIFTYDASSLGGSYEGVIRVYGASTGILLKEYRNSTNSGIHYRGGRSVTYYNGIIYTNFAYESGYDQQGRRGIMAIDYASDTVQYIPHNYATTNGSYIQDIHSSGDGKLIVATYSYGMHIYDIDAGLWTTYDNTSIPGLTPNGYDSFYSGAYDVAGERIFGGEPYDPNAPTTGYAVVMFSEAGFFRQGQFLEGDYSAGWTLGSVADLTLALNDYTPTVVRTSSDELWTYWTQETTSGEQSIVWGREQADITLLNYLTGSVEVSWDISRPNRLKFSLAQGHLFDPNNLASSLSVGVAKGRRIEIEFGETVSGTDYYQNQGVYYVNDISLSYRVNELPIISVECEDVTSMWQDASVITTQSYEEQNPEGISQGIITTYGNLESANLDWPGNGEFTGSHVITHQWIEMKLYDILEELLDHFGYVMYSDMDGYLTPLEINLGGSVVHTYTTVDRMTAYTPDLTYSNYTNRVIVSGEGLYFVEVLYPEEVVATYAGTLGWWGCRETKRLYYSEDRERVCRNIRLDITDPPTINIFWTQRGGGSASITDEDSTGLWVEVTIVAPNLIIAFSAAIAAILALGIAAIGCDGYVSGWCGAIILSLTIAISVLGYIIGCMCNFAVEVYGYPVGQEKQTFQGLANDLNHQAEIGMVVAEEIDDPFCYTIASCETVAERELAIVQAQRRRIVFEKIAHLQDEIGDIIQIIHPYSLQEMNVFITSLTRRYVVPDKVGYGGIFDTIEGWRLT